jgi:hypothetical protein
MSARHSSRSSRSIRGGASGWGGARKFRFARPGRGKSGSWRIVTAYCGPGTPVFLVTVFGNGEKANLSRAEANELAKLVKILCASYGG